MKKLTFSILVMLLMLTVICTAHPGRTDKYGGHVNKATGEYHYHNSDGTTTVAEKPSGDIKTEEKTEDITTSPESSIIVDGDSKPVTKSVAETMLTEEKPIETEEIIKVKNENGDTIIYIPNSSRYSGIDNLIFSLLIMLAIIGWLAISPLLCGLFKKIESKNSAWGIILHVPYLLFWLPSLAGRLLYKLYNNISLKEKSDEFTDDDEDNYYEEI